MFTLCKITCVIIIKKNSEVAQYFAENLCSQQDWQFMFTFCEITGVIIKNGEVFHFRVSVDTIGGGEVSDGIQAPDLVIIE